MPKIKQLATSPKPADLRKSDTRRAVAQAKDNRPKARFVPPPPVSHQHVQSQPRPNQSVTHPTKPGELNTVRIPDWVCGLPEDLHRSLTQSLDNPRITYTAEHGVFMRVCARSMERLDLKLAIRLAKKAQQLAPTADGEEILARLHALQRGESLGPLSEDQQKVHDREFRQSMAWVRQWAARCRADARAKRGAGR